LREPSNAITKSPSLPDAPENPPSSWKRSGGAAACDICRNQLTDFETAAIIFVKE